MEAIFFGHACLKVYYKSDAAFLMDPWFSRHGAFFHSWFQFPENTPLCDAALQDVTDICISHNHADHLDVSFLSHACTLKPALTLHIPQYPTDWFAKRIAHLLPGLASRFRAHEAYEHFQIGREASLFFVPEESPDSIDAAIVCMVDGQSLVNLNDARLNADQLLHIRQMTRKIDFLTLQASGASEYPINYTYPESQLLSHSVNKRRAKLDHCKKIFDLLEPARVLFFAGPPVFLDPALAQFNIRSDVSVFPDQLDIVREIERDRPDIAEKTLFLLPGEALSDTGLWSTIDLTAARLLPYTQKEAYIAAYAQRRRDVCSFDWGEPPADDLLLPYFQHMATLSPYISRHIGGDITFIVQGTTCQKIYTVDFVAGQARQGISSAPLYILTVPASSLLAVLDGVATWDDIFLSFRMTFDERTDRFIAHFKALLRYMDAELLLKIAEYETHLTGEREDVPMIDVMCGGKQFRIQRLCPHAGTDLEHHGRVQDNGTITCLAHRFCFDLETGECTNAQGYRLKVERGTHAMQPETTATDRVR
jgi:UDP-MurNAc hydroxylase